MYAYKLQIGCFLVTLYFILVYIRQTVGKTRLSWGYLYDVILMVAPFAIIFDGLTATTVNYYQEIPAINNLCHVIFYVLMDVFLILTFLYMLKQTVGLPDAGKLVAILTPGLLSIAGIVGTMPYVYYVEGTSTNYSMGLPVYIMFISVLVHFLTIIGLVVFKHNTISRRKLFSVTTFIIIGAVILGIQIAIPEALLSSVMPTLAVILIYVNFENPALKRLEKFNTEMVMGFSTLVERRDNSTGTHIHRTQEYVRVILDEMKHDSYYSKILTRDYIENVLNAAPMHDIGKIATPDYILQKPGRLDADEFAIMQEHAANGSELIKESFANINDPDYLKIAYEVARHHHEKWNGTGYPDGLAGEDIPLHARVMAIADVFDAVSADRCYRKALPIYECFDIIKNGAGSDFDPRLVDIFLHARSRIMKVYEGTSDDNEQNLS